MVINLLDNVELQDLKEDYLEMAEIIGLDNYKKLVDRYNGASVYIPTVDRLTKKDRDTLIREEFNGGNIRELAKKYHLSENWIREIVKPLQKNKSINNEKREVKIKLFKNNNKNKQNNNKKDFISEKQLSIFDIYS